jgi:hypothetical protein
MELLALLTWMLTIYRFIIVENSDLDAWRGLPGMRFKR